MKPSIIVLVDDNPTTLFYNEDVIQEIFTTTPIVQYENCEDFLNDYLKLKFEKEEQILVFLDINMPGHTGFEVLEEIEEEIEELDNLAVVMLTSSNMNSDIEKSTRFTNIIDYIEKPITDEKLNKTLAKVEK